MSNEARHSFLSRWSRRKLDAMQAAPVAPPLPATPAPELPAADTLQGLASEYREFLKPGVDEALKRAALKKLFGDPHFHFANMDKLDTYIDDYSIENPIPEAMLRNLSQAMNLGLFEEEKKEGQVAVETTPAIEASPPAAQLEPKPDATGQDKSA